MRQASIIPTVDNNVRGPLVAASLILSNGEFVGVVNHVATVRGDHGNIVDIRENDIGAGEGHGSDCDSGHHDHCDSYFDA